MADPDRIDIPRLARVLGVTRTQVEDACVEAGLDPIGGIHRSYEERVRQVIRRWAVEGRL